MISVGSGPSGISITSLSSASFLPLLVFLRFEVVMYSKSAFVCWMFFFSYLKFLPADLGVTDHPVCFGQVVLSTIQVEVPQIFTELEDYTWYVKKYYNIRTRCSSLISSNRLFISTNPSSTFFASLPSSTSMSSSYLELYALNQLCCM